MNATTHPAAEWLERNFAARGTPITLTADQQRCVGVLAAIGSLHNLHTPVPICDAVTLHPHYVAVLLQGELATYDAEALTRLVVAAHRDHVRVAIRPWASHQDMPRAEMIAAHWSNEYEADYDPESLPGILEVILHPRQADGGPYDRHPSLGDLIAAATKADPSEAAQLICPQCGRVLAQLEWDPELAVARIATTEAVAEMSHWCPT